MNNIEALVLTESVNHECPNIGTILCGWNKRELVEQKIKNALIPLRMSLGTKGYSKLKKPMVGSYSEAFRLGYALPVTKLKKEKP